LAGRVIASIRFGSSLTEKARAEIDYLLARIARKDKRAALPA
jgi:hypothetical protein